MSGEVNQGHKRPRAVKMPAVQMLGAALAEARSRLVKGVRVCTMGFLARLDNEQAEALPAAVADAYRKTLLDAPAVALKAREARDVVKQVACEEVVTVKPFEVWEDGDKVFELPSVMLGALRIKKQVKKKTQEVTIWLLFKVEAEGHEAAKWAAENTGKYFRVTARGPEPGD